MRKSLKIAAWVLGGLVLLAVVLRLALFQAWTVPDDDPVLAASIAPTLRGGDHVLLYTPGTPGFGDLVRCKDPDNPGKYVIGRVVGLENDLVELQARTLRVNGGRYDESDACKQPYFTVEHPDTGASVPMACQRVKMGGGWFMRGQVRGDVQGGDVSARVGPGRAYLLSDNRDLHEDSRDFGTVPLDSCDGRIVFRLWSKDGWGDSEARLSGIH
ncbi:MAG: signal peptidase I [Myxococcales bacterium]|nr:signal peptidase I [Myxococcales bacterium]